MTSRDQKARERILRLATEVSRGYLLTPKECGSWSKCVENTTKGFEQIVK